MFAMGANLLREEAIATATRALTKVAGNLRAASGTSACHRGDLSSTLGTFDYAHLIKSLIVIKDKRLRGSRPLRHKGTLAFCGRAPLLLAYETKKLTLLSSPLQREPRPLLREPPQLRELPLQESLPCEPFWASSLRELLLSLQACPFQRLR